MRKKASLGVSCRCSWLGSAWRGGVVVSAPVVDVGGAEGEETASATVSAMSCVIAASTAGVCWPVCCVSTARPSVCPSELGGWFSFFPSNLPSALSCSSSASASTLARSSFSLLRSSRLFLVTSAAVFPPLPSLSAFAASCLSRLSFSHSGSLRLKLPLPKKPCSPVSYTHLTLPTIYSV